MCNVTSNNTIENFITLLRHLNVFFKYNLLIEISDHTLKLNYYIFNSNPKTHCKFVYIHITFYVSYVLKITWKPAYVNNIMNDIIYLLNAATNFSNFRMDASGENDSIQQRPKSNNAWI